MCILQLVPLCPKSLFGIILPILWLLRLLMAHQHTTILILTKKRQSSCWILSQKGSIVLPNSTKVPFLFPQCCGLIMQSIEGPTSNFDLKKQCLGELHDDNLCRYSRKIPSMNTSRFQICPIKLSTSCHQCIQNSI